MVSAIRSLRVAAVSGILAAAAFLPVVYAQAGTVSGDACSATVTSLSADGEVLGEAVFPGEGATSVSPLPVDLEGSIDFSASSPEIFTSGSWSVSAAGIQVASGTFMNTDQSTNFEGTNISSTLPSTVTSSITDGALVPVSVAVDAAEGACSATGFVTGVTPAQSSPIFYTGAALALTGTTLTGALLLSKVVI